MIADTFLGDHPAPPKALTQFLLCLKMQALILPKPKSAFGFLKNKLRYKLSRFGTMKTFEAENGAWSKILNTEPDSAAFELDRLEAVLDEMAEELRQAAEQDRRQIQRKWYHNYEIERNLTCGTRQLFRTEEALLGVGPINTQVGDQVWILAGMSTPAVLRTALSGNYIFLGEAYVHGIMHGEVADGFPEETLDDILLE